MKVTAARIPDVLILEPDVFRDKRGFFVESWNRKTFLDVTGIDAAFVQDNHSRSSRNVLRGLHYQIGRTQGKLIRVVHGTVYDVAVDLRKSSATFGQWVGHTLSEENMKEVWIPTGFAHGFLVLSDYADLLYKTTDYYAAVHEHCIKWDDPEIAIDWPLDDSPLVSDNDAVAPNMDKAEVYP